MTGKIFYGNFGFIYSKLMTLLSQLVTKQPMVIEAIDMDTIPPELIEMGCLPGSEITILKKAPFGGPIYLKIDNTHLAVRKSTIGKIKVKAV